MSIVLPDFPSYLLKASFGEKTFMTLNLFQADKGQELLCEGFLNLHNLFFPLQKKTSLEIICLAE